MERWYSSCGYMVFDKDEICYILYINIIQTILREEKKIFQNAVLCTLGVAVHAIIYVVLCLVILNYARL